MRRRRRRRTISTRTDDDEDLMRTRTWTRTWTCVWFPSDNLLFIAAPDHLYRSNLTTHNLSHPAYGTILIAIL